MSPDGDDDAMWSPPDAQRAITLDEMYKLAKKIRIKVYYDTGDPDYGDSDQESAIRQGRTSALNEVADAIDDLFQFNSILTQKDLKSWRG